MGTVDLNKATELARASVGQFRAVVQQHRAQQPNSPHQQESQQNAPQPGALKAQQKK
jgi:hypothetical protein